jgi:hypothetical protein
MRIHLTRKQIVARFIYIPALTVLAMFFVSGCSPVGNYTPDPLKARGAAKNINITKQVVITNAQSYDKEDLLGFRGISINYKTFTQSLVDALNMELNKDRVVSKGSTDKQLHVSVTNVKQSFIAGGFSYGADINAEVKMGQGRTKQYLGSRASLASGYNVGSAPTKPLDAAFRDLVKMIAEDPDIQEYINK